MQRQESFKDLVDEETRHIDVVASWETLNYTYEQLRFSDPLSDAARLEEYKWIVQQMNTFLSKIRPKLLNSKDEEAMLKILEESFTPSKMELKSRKALVYQKLKQQWVKTMMTRIRMEGVMQDG